MDTPDVTPDTSLPDLMPEPLLDHYEWVLSTGGQGTRWHRLLRDEILRRLRLPRAVIGPPQIRPVFPVQEE